MGNDKALQRCRASENEQETGAYLVMPQAPGLCTTENWTWSTYQSVSVRSGIQINWARRERQGYSERARTQSPNR